MVGILRSGAANYPKFLYAMLFISILSFGEGSKDMFITSGGAIVVTSNDENTGFVKHIN